MAYKLDELDLGEVPFGTGSFSSDNIFDFDPFGTNICKLDTSKINAYDLLDPDVDIWTFRIEEPSGQNCSGWLDKVLKNSKMIGSGQYGGVYRCGNQNYVVKRAEFRIVDFPNYHPTDDESYFFNFIEPITSRRINNLIDKKICLHLTKVLASYYCQSLDENSDNKSEIITFFQFIPNSVTLYSFITTPHEKRIRISIALQLFYTVACLMIYGITHSDLHEENVLVAKTDIETIIYSLRGGVKIAVKTFGYFVHVIDFGFSRQVLDNGTTLGIDIREPANPHEKFDPHKSYGLLDDLLIFRYLIDDTSYLDKILVEYNNASHLEVREFAAGHLMQDYIKANIDYIATKDIVVPVNKAKGKTIQMGFFGV